MYQVAEACTQQQLCLCPTRCARQGRSDVGGQIRRNPKIPQALCLGLCLHLLHQWVYAPASVTVCLSLADITKLSMTRDRRSCRISAQQGKNAHSISPLPECPHIIRQACMFQEILQTAHTLMGRQQGKQKGRESCLQNWLCRVDMLAHEGTHTCQQLRSMW